MDMSIRCYVLPPSVGGRTRRQLMGDQRIERNKSGNEISWPQLAPQASTTLGVVSTVLFCLLLLQASHAISTIHLWPLPSNCKSA